MLPIQYAQVNSLIGISRGLPGAVILLATIKEKHSLMRKLVGYRNWRHRWHEVSFVRRAEQKAIAAVPQYIK